MGRQLSAAEREMHDIIHGLVSNSTSSLEVAPILEALPANKPNLKIADQKPKMQLKDSADKLKENKSVSDENSRNVKYHRKYPVMRSIILLHEDGAKVKNTHENTILELSETQAQILSFPYRVGDLMYILDSDNMPKSNKKTLYTKELIKDLICGGAKPKIDKQGTISLILSGEQFKSSKDSIYDSSKFRNPRQIASFFADKHLYYLKDTIGIVSKLLCTLKAEDDDFIDLSDVNYHERIYGNMNILQMQLETMFSYAGIKYDQSYVKYLNENPSEVNRVFRRKFESNALKNIYYLNRLSMSKRNRRIIPGRLKYPPFIEGDIVQYQGLTCIVAGFFSDADVKIKDEHDFGGNNYKVNPLKLLEGNLICNPEGRNAIKKPNYIYDPSTLDLLHPKKVAIQKAANIFKLSGRF